MTLTPAQIARRQQGIGASDVPAILGMIENRTPYQVWLEKTGRAEPFAGNQATKMGHLLEPVAVQLYQEENPSVVLTPCDTIEGDQPWMLATPDRMVFDPERQQQWLLEIKNRSRFNMDGFGERGSNTVPMDVGAQVAWQQIVTGVTSHADVGVLVDGREFATFSVPYDRELAQMLVETMGRWWATHIVKDVEPELTGLGDAKEYLTAKYALCRPDDLLEPDDEVAELVAILDEMTKLEKKVEFRKESAKVALMAKLGAHGGTKTTLGSVSWREQKQRDSVAWPNVLDAIARQFKLDRNELERIVYSHTRLGGRKRVMRYTSYVRDTPLFDAPTEQLLLDA